VSSQSSVELRFDGPHGRELGVRTPDGRFLFIAFEQENPKVIPPVPSARFTAMQSLKLDVPKAVGVDSIDTGKAERIFTVPGSYRFVVADNLETEDDAGVNGVCQVQFRTTASR
jgi:hypothetical protein